MKELVIISGKGGTGKTSIAASFAALAQAAVIADCDVDAANLHLLLAPRILRRETFRSGETAAINPDMCIQCGACREHCRFNAIDEHYAIHPAACEGCRVCWHVCPVKAVELRENVCGEWFVSETRYGMFVHAELGIAAENSGKLVATVRQEAKRLAQEQQAELVIIDGSPGIGCPVISSVAGAALALVITEPTQSGLHDLTRVAELTAHFKTPTAVCVNKADLNPGMTQKIMASCEERGLLFEGTIAYDQAMVDAVVHGRPVVEHSRGEAARQICELWRRIEQRLNGISKNP